MAWEIAVTEQDPNEPIAVKVRLEITSSRPWAKDYKTPQSLTDCLENALGEVKSRGVVEPRAVMNVFLFHIQDFLGGKYTVADLKKMTLKMFWDRIADHADAEENKAA